MKVTRQIKKDKFTELLKLIQNNFGFPQYYEEMVVYLSGNDLNIKIAVKDTGVGIPEELRPRLFTKGGRSKESQKINVNSTGYGLAIAKGIIEAHKGRIWVESEGEGKGSTFYLELPVG